MVAQYVVAMSQIFLTKLKQQSIRAIPLLIQTCCVKTVSTELLFSLLVAKEKYVLELHERNNHVFLFVVGTTDLCFCFPQQNFQVYQLYLILNE